MLTEPDTISRVIVFTDVDDTLIQTEGKLSRTAKKYLGATDRSGDPLSYFSQAQKTLLDMFQRSQAIVIPVTGRNTDALNRVEYSFESFSVVSHGAVVLLKGGTLCPQWLKEIDNELQHWPQLLERANDDVNQIIKTHNLDARSRVIVDQGIPSYISIKGTDSALADIKKHNPLDDQFYRHENGRNHALLPPYARKERAVEYIKAQLGLSENDLVIGIGDSVSDLGFMKTCQFSMMPSPSQIVQEKLSYD